MFSLAMMGISFGLKLFGETKAEKAQKDALAKTAQQEQDAINLRNEQIKQEQLQPAMIQVRQQQEQINQQIATANSPYATAINFSTLGGLKGKLGG